MNGRILTMTISIALLGTTAAIAADSIDSINLPDTWVVAEAPVARQQGGQNVIPMEEIISRFESQYNGKVVGIELDREARGDYYELELFDNEGYEWELDVDAYTGDVLKEERERHNY
ncbi:MAG: PepSY domain-containing protein [Gammaproteobacteria bacterium]